MKLNVLMLPAHLWSRNGVFSTSCSTVPSQQFCFFQRSFFKPRNQLSAGSIREPLSASSSFSLLITANVQSEGMAMRSAVRSRAIPTKNKV